MMPAVTTPSAIGGKASLTRISSMAAMSEPVHAPVPGSGMATKMNRPQKRARRTVSDFLSARCSMRVTKPLSRSLFVRSQAKILRMKSTMNGTGTRLPRMDTAMAMR